MGLSTLRKRLPKRETKPLLEIDLSGVLGAAEPGQDNILRFRELNTPDLFPDKTRATRLRVMHPSWSDLLLMQVLILASCYVPSGDDTEGTDIDEEIAALVEEQRDLFLHIYTEFSNSFPMAAISADSAKNALAQTSKT